MAQLSRLKRPKDNPYKEEVEALGYEKGEAVRQAAAEALGKIGDA